MRALMLSPEPPYPLHGGGAYRTASVLHYLARLSPPDLLLISESGQPALLPPGLVRDQQVVCLAKHEKDLLSRYLRNARRAIRGVPPLIDRLAGLENAIEQRLQGKHYDLGIIEHFWCAPYVDLMQRFCNKVVLDLHNIESVLHQRCAMFSHGVVKAGHLRFAAAYRQLEAQLLPRFSLVLATSDEDALVVKAIAPGTEVQIYPNSFPLRHDISVSEEDDLLVFSANFEYHPNIDAVEYLLGEIWPAVRRRHPELRLRLVGRGEASIRRFVKPGSGVTTTGPIEDAVAEIAKAAIVIAPLRIGSGTRLKIIEAWAAGRAVIATPLAAEGLDAKDGQNLRLAATAGETVAAIDELLENQVLRRSLGAAGRAIFESSYCWEAAWRKLDLNAQLTSAFGLNSYTENT